MINYSIIIPHHNIPNLLKRCLDSIPYRDDVEIIVVDDASDSAYKPTLHSVCRADSHANLALIELQANGGGGKARNEGLRYAKGLFILFADADDFFNYCINDILQEYADNRSVDVIYFKGNCVDSETYVSSNRLDYINNKIDNYIHKVKGAEENLRYTFHIPVCKIIRRSIIVENELRFDETRIRNDVTFGYRLGCSARKIKVDKRALYCATTRDGSVSSFRGSDRILTTIEILGRAVLFFRTRGESYYETTLSHNLYILLRRKDYVNFKQGILLLQKQGFEKNDIERFFSKHMAETAISSCVWCIIFSPMYKIRLYSLKYIPKAIFSKQNKDI